MSIDILPRLQILSINLVGQDDFADEFLRKFFQYLLDLPAEMHTFKFECEYPIMAIEKSLATLPRFMELI